MSGHDVQTFKPATDRARHVLRLAKEHAKRLGCAAIDPEHILLGILQEGRGVAAHVFKYLGVTISTVQQELETRTSQASPQPVLDPSLSQASDQVLDWSIEEAARLKHNFVGTEHLGLALSRLSEGVVPEILHALGVDEQQVRRGTNGILGTDLSP